MAIYTHPSAGTYIGADSQRAALARAGWTMTVTDAGGTPPPGPTPADPGAVVPTLEQRVAALESGGGGGGGSAPADATTTTKGIARILGGTATTPTVPAASVTGVLSDGQIPDGIARDAEVTAAVVQAVADLRGGNVPANLDTLLEIVNQLATDESGAAALAATVAQKAPRLTPTVPAKTSAYTAIAGDLVLADATAAAVPVTIPAPAAGASIAVKKTDTSTNPVTLAMPDGSTITLLTQHETRTLVATGSTWYVTSGLITLSALDGRYAPIGSSGVNPADIGYDLILLLGQSNMSGYSSSGFDATRFDVPDRRVQQYGASGSYAGVISEAVEPLAQRDTPPGIGPGVHFARWYLGSVPANRRVLLVPAAMGSTPLSGTNTNRWKTTTTPAGNNLYSLAVAQAQAALAAAGANARYVAALWIQGETDADQSIAAATYAADLDTLITQLRTDLGVPDLPFVIGQMVPDYLPAPGTRAAINAVQAATGSRPARTRFAPGPFGLNQNDGNHYSAPAQRILGRRMFDAYRRAVTGTADPALPAAPGQVTGLTVGTVGDSSIPLSWTAVAGASAYYVEYKTSAGSTWTRAGTPSGTSITISSLTNGTAYDFRVTAISNGGPGTASAVATGTPLASGSPPGQVTGLAAGTPGGTSVPLSWTAVSGATAYTVQYKASSSSTWLTFSSSITGATATVTGLTASTAYDFRVIATNASGSGTPSATVSATTSAGGGATTYAADTFSRSDAASAPGTAETGGFAWTVNSGTWGINGGKLRGAPSGNFGDCTIDDGQANGTLSLTAVTTGSLGLLFRCSGTGNDNGYLFWRNGSNYTLSKRTGQFNFAALGTTSGVTPAAGDVLSVIANGSSITCKVNGTTVLTVTDSTNVGTKHGAWVYQGTGSDFDNFSHTDAVA